MFFDLWSAVGIFISDFFFWYLTTIYVKRCNGNLIIQVMLVAGAINANDFISKYLAPRFFSNIIPATLAAAAGAGVAMFYDKCKKGAIKK